MSWAICRFAHLFVISVVLFARLLVYLQVGGLYLHFTYLFASLAGLFAGIGALFAFTYIFANSTVLFASTPHLFADYRILLAKQLIHTKKSATAMALSL
ncbi:hypothetical protein [Bacillus sp. NTK034]|uniref:hypothetical protein n=1 Tax=Bacillus sp. NTK034 TaxID=2802176 RepID=UPI001A90AE8A|nr:hypothetical protein [Bacillus sp. NTK034]MBN8202374.1 hypothetical protein [Bacillus sp. NTK034]